MAQLAGKYQLVENKNIYELLIKLGLSEDAAKKGSEVTGSLSVEVDGEKIRLLSDANGESNVNEFVLNKEIDEVFPLGGTSKSTATLDGNVLTINSKAPESSGSRVLTFSDAGLEMKITSTKGDVNAEGTRIYKRV